MSLENYRQLIALRYAAESMDEMNVFLARALELQVRLMKEGANDRIKTYLAGAVATLIGSVAVGGDFFAPGLTLSAFLLLMALSGFFHLRKISEQNRELAVDQKSIKEYLRKATRDRQENKVAVTIQNRKAAAALLESDPENLPDTDRTFLEDSVKFWGERLEERDGELAARADDDVWCDDEAKLSRLRQWIADELKLRPLKGDVPADAE